jgi:hypothetical protein
MTRPKFSKKLIEETFNRADNPKGKGLCWHCGKKLTFKNRTFGLRSAWHMDHYPVVYRDIENQCCIGITNPNNPTNLVPSCISCNLTHKYEKNKWYYCGRSQCKCEYCCSFKYFVIFFLFISFVTFSTMMVLKYLDVKI